MKIKFEAAFELLKCASAVIYDNTKACFPVLHGDENDTYFLLLSTPCETCFENGRYFRPDHLFKKEDNLTPELIGSLLFLKSADYDEVRIILLSPIHNDEVQRIMVSQMSENPYL
jgi:hypothetical protein